MAMLRVDGEKIQVDDEVASSVLRDLHSCVREGRFTTVAVADVSERLRAFVIGPGLQLVIEFDEDDKSSEAYRSVPIPPMVY
jgi:hypothetical protein